MQTSKNQGLYGKDLSQYRSLQVNTPKKRDFAGQEPFGGKSITGLHCQL